MKFWVIETNLGETIGCELKKKAALEYAKSRGYEPDECEVEAVDVPVTVDTIRRLLGNLGGYSSSSS